MRRCSRPTASARRDRPSGTSSASSVVEPLLEALPLLVARDQQEDLDDPDPVRGEQGLERVDLLVPPGPDVLRHEIVDANDEDVFVVRPVEDRDLAMTRHLAVDTPQEVVGE